MSRPPMMIFPLVASSSLRRSRTSVVLPEPDAPTMKTNSPLSIPKLTSIERDDVRLVDLRDVLEDDHRPRRGQTFGRAFRRVVGHGCFQLQVSHGFGFRPHGRFESTVEELPTLATVFGRY